MFQMDSGNPFPQSGFLFVREQRCYTLLRIRPSRREFGFDRTMIKAPHSRRRSCSPSAPPGGHEFRWLLSNSSTKVLFGPPAEPSTVVPYAAAPASLLFNRRSISCPYALGTLKLGD